ncbi:MAG: ferritin family protein [Deltaproteobacteria bacterium]|nr:ferritin family protein [Deltaproteobacteria bacterium]
MTDPAALEILKNALLLERRGQAFYAKVAEQASSPAVKDFFGLMADEEGRHIDALSDQYRAYLRQGAFLELDTPDGASAGFATSVLSDRLRREISAADFEAAAIGAAMMMERDAVRLYGDRARATADPDERALYEWLATWEAGHLEFLARVEREVTESVWNDNRFWPM